MKVCFIGSGSIGKRHIKNLKYLSNELNFELEIHLLRSTQRELEDELKTIISKCFYKIDEIDEWYDAVFITNPTHLHLEVLKQFNDKSNNFFIEKPVFDTLNVDIDDLRLKDNKNYYVACPLRYTKVLLEAQKILAKEKVYSCRSISSSYLPLWRPGVNYKNTYSAHKDQGGGVRIDLIHEWDYLSTLFGFPEEVTCVYGKYSHLEIDSEDIAVYIGRYQDKIIEIHLDYCGKETRRNFDVITENDVYLFDITNSRISKNGKVIDQFNEEPNDKYIEEMKMFLDIVHGKTKSKNDIRHAMQVMRIALGEKMI